MKTSALAPDIGDLPQAQPILLGQYTSRYAVGNTHLNMLITDLPKKMVGLRYFQSNTREIIDQRLQ